MTAARVENDAPAIEADALQAAYFRRTLFVEREQTASVVRKLHDEVGRRIEHGAMSGIPHLRSQVRSHEAELHYLDGLIQKLDRRFAALWTALG